MEISLSRLRQLIAVADAGSFSRAAEELNLSQPALSRSVAGLEAMYGFQIFNRLGHGVAVTTAGCEAIRQARELLQGMRVFDRNLRLFGKGVAGELSLGLTPQLASEALPALADRLFASTSNVQVRTLIRPVDTLLEALRSDTIEMIFCASSQVQPDQDIEVTEISSMTPVYVVRVEHPVAPRVSMQDLWEFPWASAVVLQSTHLRKDREKSHFQCDNYHVLRELTLRNDFVLLCSPKFVEAELRCGSLRILEVTDFKASAAPIRMLKLTNRVLSPLALKALSLFSSHIESG